MLNEVSNSQKLRSFWNDFDNGEKHILPNLGIGKCDSICRIDPKILKDVIRKSYDVNVLVIDCRYEFEYEGGHVKDALNISTVDEIEEFYRTTSPTILIFHCEFSSVRAPFISKKLRSYDRSQNPYPKLKFPEIYILKGGYQSFYNEFPEMCVPQYYVPMHTKKYKRQLSIEEAKRKSFKNKKI